MKKVLAIVLSVVMLLGCVVFSAHADDFIEITYPETAVDVAANEITHISVVGNGSWFDTDGNGHPSQTNDFGTDQIMNFTKNEVVTYKINVAAEGTYDFSVNVGYGYDTTDLVHVYVDDVEVGTISMKPNLTPNGKYCLWSAPIQLALSAGEHNLKIVSGATIARFEGVRFAPGGTLPKYENQYSTAYDYEYDANDTTQEHAIFGTYGYRTMINAEFDAFSILSANWTSKGSVWNLYMYKWAGTLDDTLSADPIAEKNEIMVDNDQWITLEFEPQEAGEYLFYIAAMVGTPKICVAPFEAIDGVRGPTGYTYDEDEPASQLHVPHIVIMTTEPYAGELFSGTTDENATDETTADLTGETTAAPAGETTEAPAADTTVALVDETTAAPAGETTAAGTDAATGAGTAAGTAAGTKAPADTTAAAAAEGCKAVVGSMSAIALVAVASAAAVVLKKKED